MILLAKDLTPFKLMIIKTQRLIGVSSFAVESEAL